MAFDVAVIGGGIIGTAAAACLAEAGQSVVLIERGAIADGASGRNSGVLQLPPDPALAELHRASLASVPPSRWSRRVRSRSTAGRAPHKSGSGREALTYAPDAGGIDSMEIRKVPATRLDEPPRTGKRRKAVQSARKANPARSRTTPATRTKPTTTNQ